MKASKEHKVSICLLPCSIKCNSVCSRLAGCRRWHVNGASLSSAKARQTIINATCLASFCHCNVISFDMWDSLFTAKQSIVFLDCSSAYFKPTIYLEKSSSRSLSIEFNDVLKKTRNHRRLRYETASGEFKPDKSKWATRCEEFYLITVAEGIFIQSVDRKSTLSATYLSTQFRIRGY